jgi:hypothetical protein
MCSLLVLLALLVLRPERLAEQLKYAQKLPGQQDSPAVWRRWPETVASARAGWGGDELRDRLAVSLLSVPHRN